MRKWKIGLLGAAALFVIMLTPVFFFESPSLNVQAGAVSRNDPEAGYLAFQVNNRYGVRDGKRFEFTNDAKPFIDENSRIQIPLRAASERAGLRVDWDNATQTATIRDGKTTAVLVVGQNTMQLDDEVISLPSAPMVRDGNAYIPARALESIFGWKLTFLSMEKGGYLLYTSDDDQPALENAKEVLGPSVEQLIGGGMIVRKGSDRALIGGQQVPFAEPVTFDDDENTFYLPVSMAVELMGGSVGEKEGELEITLGTRVARLDPDKNTATLDRAPGRNEVYAIHRVEDTVYVSDDLLAALLGMYKNPAENDTIVFTRVQLENYPDQSAALAPLGALLDDTSPLAAESAASSIPVAEHYIALTFDDGPTGNDGGRTAKLLDGLKERGAHATFFLCGYRIKDFPGNMTRYLAEGHELGNHTMDHKNLTKQSVAGIHSQVDDNSDLIAKHANAKPTVMRPTGGNYNNTVLAEMKNSGLPVIMWSLDTLDWQNRDASSVEKAIVNRAKDGDIVLMHDLYDTTITGALNAIDKLKEKGFAFVTVSELAQIKGVTLEPGVVYSQLP